MLYMQIQTIEEKTGLDRATIRYYEQEGLICPQRLQNGYRNYSERDLQDLLKIKLLRQLGLSLDAILQLMEGKDDLKKLLEIQLIVLKDHKVQVENAEAICKMIMQDNVTYETIQPYKYFNAIEQKIHTEKKVIEAPKTECVYCEVHPVRRFLGRYLDHLLSSTILMLIVIVFLRVRPVGDFQNIVINIGAIFLSMLLNALFLCMLGTTPGKFAMGVFLKDPEGKNISFVSALQREWAVFRYGEGFHIPIYSWIRIYKSYRTHTTGLELEWDYDYDADVLYTDWSARRPVYATILAVICTVGIIFSAQDSMFPKHRSTDLTLAEFAENYNDYTRLNGMSTYLSEKGEWYRLDAQNPQFIIDHLFDYKEDWNFMIDDNGYLDVIKIEIQTNSRIFYTDGSRPSLAMFTAFMSQPGSNVTDANSASRTYSELTYFENKYPEYEFDYNGVTVKWEVLPPATDSDKQYKLFIEIIMP